MKCLHRYLWMTLLLLCAVSGYSQSSDSSGFEIALVSDTQAPFRIEKMLHGDHSNELATQKLFHDMLQRKPRAVLITGDVVSIGYQESRWIKMDGYLDSLRNNNIPVSALPGNHDLMISAKKGEAAFRKRFPDMISTGFLRVIDSIAFVMLNSNFKQLSQAQATEQDNYYRNILAQLDKDDAIRLVVVCCHHAPYSNSTVVGSNKQVQEKFVKPFLLSKKAKLFITGHAHDFEHFRVEGKDFLTIGGGGGIHQPLNQGADRMHSLSAPYDPEFHYLLLQKQARKLLLISRRLLPDMTGFENAYQFTVQ
jgi:Icc-related predicted phosphoesterase